MPACLLLPVRRVSLALAIAAALGGCSGGSGDQDPAGAPGVEPVALGAALPDTPGVQFAATDIVASEDNRHVPVQVLRTGAGSGRTVVGYQISGGSATPGLDLARARGQLVWEDGETGPRNIDLQVFADVESELDETVELSLEPLEGDIVVAGELTLTVQDADCSASLPARIDTDLTLDAACYRLTGDVELAGGAQLSIDAGTTLLADAGVRLDVREQATLVARGTTFEPVTLAGTDPQAGWWRGVTISSSALLHRLVEVRLRDAVVGLDVAIGATLGGVSGGAIGNVSQSAVRLPLEAVAAFDGATAFDRASGVAVLDSRLPRGEALSVPALSTHYALGGSLLVSGELDIQAGAELRFAAGARLLVDSDGSLAARGSAAAPIVLRGERFEPGAWAGVQLLDSGADNRLEHTVITNGGGDPARDGNLSLVGQGTRLQVSDVTLAGSSGVGLWLDRAVPGVEFERLGFTDNFAGQVRQSGRSGDFGTL